MCAALMTRMLSQGCPAALIGKQQANKRNLHEHVAYSAVASVASERTGTRFSRCVGVIALCWDARHLREMQHRCCLQMGSICVLSTWSARWGSAFCSGRSWVLKIPFH